MQDFPQFIFVYSLILIGSRHVATAGGPQSGWAVKRVGRKADEWLVARPKTVSGPWDALKKNC